MKNCELIRKDDALNQLCLDHRDVIYIDKQEAAKRIRALPSINPDDKWILSSEKLPEYGKEVIVTIWTDTVEIGYFDKESDGKIAFHADAFIEDIECVDAWMPLPEPYKRGRK